MADGNKSAAQPSAAAKKKNPTNDREIAEATGVTSVGERVRAEQASTRVRKWVNKGNGKTYIEGETVEEVRARARREREEAEPTAFQRSIIGGPGPQVETVEE